MVGVGDCKLVGPTGDLPNSRGVICKAVDVEDPEPSDLFLSCVHEVSDIKFNGVAAQIAKYNMRS